MVKIRHILLTFALLLPFALEAQETNRDYIRYGNRHYNDTQYHEAETNYLKSIEKNPTFEAYYNLGNALLMQGQDSVAYENFKTALRHPCNNVMKKAMAYHNMGNLQYYSGLAMMKTGADATLQFQQAVDLYKSSLRCNSEDNMTRYNLAMAQYMLKKSQDNQQQQQQEEQKQEEQKQEQQQQDSQQQKQEQQQNTMSEEAMQQLLNSAQQDEKAVQKKVKEQNGQPQRRQLEKDW